MTESDGAPPPSSDVDDPNERVGPFPSWTALYVTVIIYSIGLIAILSYLTVRLDFS